MSIIFMVKIDVLFEEEHPLYKMESFARLIGNFIELDKRTKT